MIKVVITPLRELTQLPTPGKCFERTIYPAQKGELCKRYVTPACIYLTKDGKCELNACVKNTKVREI